MDKHSIHQIYQIPKYKEVIDKTLNGPQVLEKASIIYSCLVNNCQGKLYMIDKIKDQTPQFPFDWDMYLILKAFCKTLVTTGQILKDEKEYKLFHNYDVFKENQELLEFHKKRNPQRQKIFLLSNSISEDDVSQYINSQYYEPILIEQTHANTKHKTLPQQNFLNGYLQKLVLHYGQPLLLQFGVTTLNEYFSQTAKHKNLINLFIVAEFNGQIPEVCRGKQVQVNFNKYFSCLYTSEPIHCTGGSITYLVYGSKIQP